MIINQTAGGTALNFRFKSYTTEAALLLDTPPENTIGVVTTTPIGKYAFSATEPTTNPDGTALSGGEVWIKTTESSSTGFNALRKNCLMAYPKQCYQYVNNAWALMTVSIYQDSTWKDFKTYLYSFGVFYSPVTTATTASDVPTAFELQSDNIYIYYDRQTTGNAYRRWRFDTKVDMTRYSTLEFVIKPTIVRASVSIRVGTVETIPTGEGYTSFTAFASANNIQQNVAQTVVVDVSGIVGQQYICLEIGTLGNSGIGCKTYSVSAV